MTRALLLALTLAGAAAAQEARSDSVYAVAEVLPAIVGGPAALAASLVYPEDAVADGVEGTVVVGLVVGADGVPSDVAALRSPSESLAEAAVAAVRAARFTPGTVGGAPVAVRTAVPVRFQLRATADAPLALRPPERPRQDTDPVEEMPELIGGLRGLQMRVEYPPEARRRGIQGQVVVQLVVTEGGGVEDPVVIRPVHPLLDAAALDAVRNSHFRPGRQDGRPVRVRFAVPLTFRLR